MTTNVEDVETSVAHELDSLRQSTPNPCIRKLPEFMASVPIEPLVVSIGPLYYDKVALKPFHEMKLRHLQSLLQYADKDFDLGQYIDILREKEHEIRSYYPEKLSLSSNEFIKMILIDAAFIIFFFIMSSDLYPRVTTHPVRNLIEVKYMVVHDLFLVENQLPFFVLNDVFHKSFVVRFSDLTFKDVACNFISCTSLPGHEVADTIAMREKLRDTPNIKHLVDCLRICCLPTKLRGQHPIGFGYAGEFPKTAKELKDAGVKFILSKSKSLLDITFSKGELQVPELKVGDGTSAILRSMALYELCHRYYDSYIIDYLYLMDELIDTPEDVQILVKNGIIRSWLGSDEEVATLFNDVAKDVELHNPGFYYALLCRELDAYANTKWNHWKAVLRRDYFNHPWSVISLIYAVVLLILTALQVYTGFKA